MRSLTIHSALADTTPAWLQRNSPRKRSPPLVLGSLLLARPRPRQEHSNRSGNPCVSLNLRKCGGGQEPILDFRFRISKTRIFLHRFPFGAAAESRPMLFVRLAVFRGEHVSQMRQAFANERLAIEHRPEPGFTHDV